MSNLRRAERTGNFRFRHHRDWRGRDYIVLQAEWRGFVTTYSAGHTDTECVREWRDARVQDLPVSTNPDALRALAKGLNA